MSYHEWKLEHSSLGVDEKRRCWFLRVCLMLRSEKGPQSKALGCCGTKHCFRMLGLHVCGLLRCLETAFTSRTVKALIRFKLLDVVSV